jgi:hypothetical protein
MLLAFLAAAAAAPELERCTAAVHGALETAVAACRPSSAPINVFAPATAADRCRPALQAGVEAGSIGPRLPATARAGLVRHFDELAAQCSAAPAKDETPTLEQVQLWNN